MTEKEIKILKYGMLVGQLEAIATFNNKTNHGYEFNLEFISNFQTSSAYLDDLIAEPHAICESYELNKIDNKDAFTHFYNLLHDKWFYAYQNKDEDHLSDLNDSFSLFMYPWKEKWIEDFVDFLLQTLNPINIFEIIYVDVNDYYASDYNEFILECEEQIVHFKLNVSD